ncbi:Pentatricopeptide repeat [Thalictrum thalictroides]|uniref:Pentatricopeptide repeat n=1 Tax=Thalictrum thalictroides TaxID=46969 RepID=A0A7J6US49_THATH|nr:Pentatricopeptide repeat [Thalictrum thalictroides]
MEAMLQSCMKTKAWQPGKQIHAQLITIGIEMKTGTLPSKLLGMYAGCGDMRSAKQVFEYMRKPTVFAWNWMISALAFQGHCKTAIEYFRLMRKNGAFPNKFTFSFLLKACVGLMDINKGKELHCVINRMCFKTDVSVLNALIDMYCKCRRLDVARKLFDKMTEKDVASWTSMICGYSHSGNLEESQILFERMGSEGLEPNDFTWNAMISGYAHSGHCSRAFELFSSMRSRGLTPDLITWNALIAGLVQSNRNVEAITLFSKMLTTGLKPNPVTIAGLLPACGSSGLIHIGKQVHGLMYRRLLQLNIYTASALIDMYSKCGCVRDARSVFDQIEVKNIASWNAMIGCYGKHGLADASILLFERMNDKGLQANQITYTCLLSACSHAGLLEKGMSIFNSMEENENVELCQEHYACMVDLLSRAGKLEEAYELMNKMPMEINDSIVGAFFNGCRIHRGSNIAKKMAEKILGMELRKAGDFVTLSNIYAAEGEWEWVESVRKVMKEKGVCKKAGFSWVENKDGISCFKV